MLRNMNGNWRAAIYLSVGQIGYGGPAIVQDATATVQVRSVTV